jgi:hypothetical protein
VSTKIEVHISQSLAGWGYAITHGEGEGSLKAAEFSFTSYDDAWMGARPELQRVLKQLECEHVFDNGQIGRTCRYCGLHEWKQR